jgi:acyl-coenzyme A thioesterase PaaI-like protein
MTNVGQQTETVDVPGEMAELFERLSQIPADRVIGIEGGDLLRDGVRLRAPIRHGDAVVRSFATAVLADAACGFAVARCFTVGVSGPTIELRVDHAGEPSPQARWMIAESQVRFELGESVFLTAEVSDDTGRPLAFAQGHFVVLGSPVGAQEMDRLPALGREDLSRALRDAVSRESPESSTWTVPTDLVFSNPRWQVHGGMLMGLGELAQRRLLRADGGGEALEPRPLRITCEYLRPVPVDGADLTCRSEYTRRGKRFRGLRTELVRADGRVAAEVSGLWTS